MEEMSCKVDFGGHERYENRKNSINCWTWYFEQLLEPGFGDIRGHRHLAFYKLLRVGVSNVLPVMSPILDLQIVSTFYRVSSFVASVIILAASI